MKHFLAVVISLFFSLPLFAQSIPDVTCSLEDLPVKAVVAWQFPQTQGKVQVVVLRDPRVNRRRVSI